MRNQIILIALVTSLVGCTGGKAQLAPDARALVLELGFDEALMANVARAGESIERLVGVTADFESIPANGIVIVTAPDAGRRALIAIRNTLSESEYSAYLNDVAFGFDADRVAVVRSRNDYEYFAIVRTDGINYDLEHEDVIARYRQWDGRYGLSLIGAGQDWLEAEFQDPPDDWLAFAEEVYAFCPDVVDQGTGDVETLAREMQTSNSVYLWWD